MLDTLLKKEGKEVCREAMECERILAIELMLGVCTSLLVTFVAWGV